MTRRWSWWIRSHTVSRTTCVPPFHAHARAGTHTHACAPHAHERSIVCRVQDTGLQMLKLEQALRLAASETVRLNDQLTVAQSDTTHRDALVAQLSAKLQELTKVCGCAWHVVTRVRRMHAGYV